MTNHTDPLTKVKPVVHYQFLLLQIMFTSVFTFNFQQMGRRGQWSPQSKVGT